MVFSMSPKTDHETMLRNARAVIQSEGKALSALEQNLDEAFIAALQTILQTKGHCVVAGIGKSGHVGRKISATLASTGTPSFFIHPTEASHGDLGMIAPGACVLAISNSGENRELKDLVVHCGENDIPLIAITGNADSFLARAADHVLLLPQAPEACPQGLAPTTSTTMTLALGDAIAVTVMQARGFSEEDFGARHPGGMLGLRLQKVSAYLRENPGSTPVIAQGASAREVVNTISEGRQGCVAVIDEDGCFTGMITDGDLRRAMDEDFFAKTPEQMMTANAITITTDQRVMDALELMREKRIANLFVLMDGKPAGLIHSKDLMQRGYM